MASSNLNSRLFIEGREVDLSDDIDLALTYTIDNVQDISKINSNFTKTIVVPGSHNNNVLFNYIFDIKSVGGAQQGAIGFYHPTGVTIGGIYTPPPNIGYNYDPLIKARAYIMQGSSVCMSGYARLLSATSLNGDISYEIQISSDLGSFISTLGQYRLEDLANPSATTYDQTLSFSTKLDASTITNSWDYSTCNPDNSIPFWPLIDYGDFDTVNATNFYVQNFKPCLFAKHYWDMIFDFAGYRYDSDFIDSRFFRRLIIPYKDGAILPKAGNANATNGFDSAQTPILQSNSITNTSDGVYPYPTSVGSSTVYVSGVFTSPSANEYLLNVSFDSTLVLQPTDAVDVAQNNDYYIYVIYDKFQSDGTTIISQEYDLIKFPRATYIVNGNGATSFEPGPSVALTKNIFLNQGEKLKVRVMTKMDTTFPFVLVGWPTVIPINGNAWLVVKAHPSLTISYGTVGDQSTIDFTQFVPKDVKMVDYINSIIKLFNLYPVIDRDDPYLFHIYTREEFYDGLVVHDWTKKVDNSQPIKTVPIPSLDSKNLKFSYKEDKDWWNKNYTQQYGGIYGQLLINTGYEFSNDTKDVLDKLVFSPTVPVQYSNNPFPCETTIEILNAGKSEIFVSGYNTLAGGTLPSGNGLAKARIGNKILYFGQTYTITFVYNPYHFKVDRDVVRTGGPIDGTYYAKTDTFQYLTDNNKSIPCIYDSTDNNVTRKFIKTNLRILCWAEGDQTLPFHPDQVPCNQYYIQDTPILSGTSYVYINPDGNITINDSGSIVASSYPVITHLNGYKNSSNAVNGTAPTQDLLFSEPIATFFDSTGFNYPTFNLYTGYWMNNVNELIDPEAKLVTLNADIDPVDINQLDLRDYIYIDGTQYRINKITDYRPDRSLTTSVELVRLPYRQYQDNPILPTPIEIILIDKATTGTIGNIKVDGVDVDPARYYYLDTIGPGQESIFTTRHRGTGTLTVDADADTRYVSVQYGTASHTKQVSGGTLTYSFTGVTFDYQGPVIVTLSDTGTPDGPPPGPEYAYFRIFGNPNTESSINQLFVYNDPSDLHSVEYISGDTMPGIGAGLSGLYRTSIASSTVPTNVKISLSQSDGDFLTLQGPPSLNDQRNFDYFGGGIYDFTNILLLPNQTYNAWVDGPNPGTITIQNNHGFASINQIYNVARFSLPSPVSQYNNYSGTHAASEGVISFNVTTGLGHAQGYGVVYKNGVAIDHINYNGPGTYNFNLIFTFTASDYIYIEFNSGTYHGTGPINISWNYDGRFAFDGNLQLYVNGYQVLFATTTNGGSVNGVWLVNPGDTVEAFVTNRSGAVNRVKGLSVYDGGTLLFFNASLSNQSYTFTPVLGHGYTVLGSTV